MALLCLPWTLHVCALGIGAVVEDDSLRPWRAVELKVESMCDGDTVGVQMPCPQASHDQHRVQREGLCGEYHKRTRYPSFVY